MPKAPSQRGLAATNGSRLGEFQQVPPQSRHAPCQLPQGDALGTAAKFAAMPGTGSPSQALTRQLPQRGSPWQNQKLYRTAKASPFEERLPPVGGRCRTATKGGVWHRIAMTERASPFGTAVQPCGNIPSREKAMLENPQIFQHCKFKNIFPLMMRRATRSAF